MPETQQKQEPKKEKKLKVQKCSSCGKPIKYIKRYYRNEKYFCTKRCYKNFKTKSEEKPKE